MGQKGGKNDKNGRYSMFPIWWHQFKSKYLYEYVSYENAQGMKSFLKFWGFSKIFKKRAYSTPHAPKNANENFEKSENLVLGLWGGETPAPPPNRNFWKPLRI